MNIHDAGEELRIFVDEHALPRDYDVFENQRGIDFIEPRRQGMAFGIRVLRVKIAAKNLQPGVFIGMANAIA
jgi:hypothetical protein